MSFGHITIFPRELSTIYPGVNASEIANALRTKGTEKFILELLRNCSEGVEQSIIRLAMENKYSEDLIMELLSKYNPICNEDYIGEYHIRTALFKKYSTSLMTELMKKIQMPDSNLTLYLEYLINHGSCPILVQEYLAKLEENSIRFSPITVLGALKNGYSEDVFLEIFRRTNQEESIKKIDLSKVIELYSVKTAEDLLNKGISVNDVDLTAALQHHYSEETISIMIDQMKDNVSLLNINLAKQMGYSEKIILKMQDKCIKTDG